MNSGSKSAPPLESVTGSVLGPVLQVLSELVESGLLVEYAIGGAVGVLYYIEPVLTYDFDVVCHFPGSGLLIDPSPLFADLRRRGYAFGEEDRVVVEGVPVQFIPAEPGLLEEAMKKAVAVQIEGVATRVLTLEHLMANMLRIHRPKDRAKLALIAESHRDAFDQDVFFDILSRHGLTEQWERHYGPEAGN
ncbi:MAG: hypothetical protein QGH42_10890 [Kiritimatiellia bacterium]|jgi:hypothetical protein|nr:hypothetical protein [Kiritimatiellia bacterium]MDP6809541.1 hypothetical protein [Kiritimatiellia bacterium]MDP7024728.1 hypothetical protein [Kiritimatiellia bacterium]